MTIVDRRLECETCHFRFDDFSLLRLHKKQKEGVCESYDVTLEDEYTRKQIFKYKQENIDDSSSNQGTQLVHPIRKSPILKHGSDDSSTCTPATIIKEEENKEICIGPFKLKMKTVSPLLKCSFCKIQFNIDNDKNASFKLVEHIQQQHPIKNFNFRYTPLI